MKLYVNPVSLACTAKCRFCITKYRRGDGKNEILKLKDLKQVLKNQKFEKIEITGGGEPTLHPKISEIIKICSEKAPTIMYTNASTRPLKEMELLSELCISRAHYDQKENQKIMGINYDIDKFAKLKVPIKFSVMLHKSGIHTSDELFKYLCWAENFAKKTVVRQLFDYEDVNYRDFIKKEFVGTEKLAKKLHIRTEEFNPEENIVFYVGDMEVEFERRSCACENTNPVLYANGELKDGWE